MVKVTYGNITGHPDILYKLSRTYKIKYYACTNVYENSKKHESIFHPL